MSRVQNCAIEDAFHMFEERRQTPRQATEVRAMACERNATTPVPGFIESDECVCTSVSQDSLFLETEKRWDAGSELYIQVYLPDRKRTPVLSGTVIRNVSRATQDSPRVGVAVRLHAKPTTFGSTPSLAMHSAQRTADADSHAFQLAECVRAKPNISPHTARMSEPLPALVFADNLILRGEVIRENDRQMTVSGITAPLKVGANVRVRLLKNGVSGSAATVIEAAVTRAQPGQRYTLASAT